MPEHATARPRVVVIGGGGTGIATLYDLVLRGFRATLLERGELTSGTTGRHHGQLHSGARYAVHDRRIGSECIAETTILTRIARQSIEHNYGIFVAVDEKDLAYLPAFLDGCAESGIATRELSVAEAREMEPGITAAALATVLVPDGTIDAFRLPLQFAASALAAGGVIRPHCRVTAIETSDGRITGVVYHDRTSGVDRRLACDVVINAAGAWGGRVAGLAGCNLDITPSPGTMVAFEGRYVNMVVSRLHGASDGDIVVPQRLQSIVGSTQSIASDPDDAVVRDGDVEMLRSMGAALVPAIADATVRAAWAAPRPLAGHIGGADGSIRTMSRDYLCVDHEETDGVSGLYSIIGGKATVLRRMAEAVTDLVCRASGIDAPCTTADTPLEDYRRYFVRQREAAASPTEGRS